MAYINITLYITMGGSRGGLIVIITFIYQEKKHIEITNLLQERTGQD